MARRSSKKASRRRDPYRAREAKKYTNPIPSREYITQVLSEIGTPVDFSTLASTLELDAEDQQEALRRRLAAMERDGQLVRNRRDAFCLVNKRDLIVGRVIGHPDGFGFVKPDNSGEDLFLDPKEMRGLFHDDRVVVRVAGMDRKGRLEAAVVEVLERNTRTVVGRLHREGGVGFVVPDNKRLAVDIIIPRTDMGGARQGQIVVAEIVEQPTRRTQPIGRVVEVLGEHMAPGMETDIAIRTHDIPVDWSEAVRHEMTGIGESVEDSDKKGRTDLRHLPLVTIDGADARDFDDAVYCESRPKGWKLLVCIADVSSYVAPGSALDEEAMSRGNSVYFPDRVIPMLPEVLSNGLCSLNPNVDRLCMTCELLIDQEGKITRSRFYEAVMHSQARLTYDQVAAMLIDGDPDLCARYDELLPHLHELYALYQILQAARRRRGAIDFDTVETKFAFSPGGKIEQILPLQRNDAHRLIEECMLAANVAAARLLLRRKMPALYRIHEGPTREKLAELREFLGELALRLGGGADPQAQDYAKLMERVRGRPDAHLIQTVLLRSLAQAIYSATNVGHFGLSYPAYTHFTSPIRRYPDLLIHRALKHLAAGEKPDEFEYSLPALQTLGEHCSSTERRADEATRDAVDWLKCEYMQDRVGEEFDGVITSVTSFGLFVELTDIFVDGLVHITELQNDWYHFEPVGHRLVGERTGKVYRLGDSIRVKVAAVDLDDRKIDFVLASGSGKAGPGPTAKKRGKTRRRQYG